MKFARLFVYVLLILLLPAGSKAQSWGGILAPARGIDWSKAGIPGGIPSGSWTQCGATIAAYSGTADAINKAISSCGTNEYVLLGPGNFNLSTSIFIQGKNRVALRGSGASKTFLVFGAGANHSCMGGASSCLIGVQASDGSFWDQPANLTNWTAGYTQATNQITLSNTSNIKPNATMIVLDQDDNGYAGYGVPSGRSIDNGGFFACADKWIAGIGCAKSGSDSGFARVHRYQTEIVEATAVNGNVVTITPRLQHPNWRAGQFPQAWLIQPNSYVGIENLSIDGGAARPGNSIGFSNFSYGWIRGVRIMNAWQASVSTYMCTHMQIQDNYIFNTGQNFAFADNYGMRLQGANHLIQNNILQKNTSQIIFEGPSSGDVIAYNFTINDFYPSDSMLDAFRPHSEGDDYQLYEGNVGADVNLDADHGTHLMETMFRNFFTGWESCGGFPGICGSPATYSGSYPTGTYGVKDNGTNPIIALAYNRYVNSVGNVLGTPGYHTLYATAGHNNTIYNLGQGFNGLVSDPLVARSALLWGNYDTVTGASRWCGVSSDTGWAKFCAGNSEIPTNAAAYPNPIPTVGDTATGQSALPASFYLSSKPSWFGSTPWPAIGPDVTNGNIGQCSGRPNTAGHFSGLPATSANSCAGTGLTMPAWGGHVNAIPAMNCFLNVMGGKPDGTNGALAFDADTCYGKSGAGQALPPTGLKAVVK